MVKKNKAFYQLTRKGVMAWLSLIVFFCLWTFVLGLLVGRGFSPVHFDVSSLQKELTDLKEAVMHSQGKQLQQKTSISELSETLEFHEKLKSNTPETKIKEPPAPRQKKPLKKKRLEKNKPKVLAQSKQKPVKLIKKPGVGKRLAIQVASVKDEKAAAAIVKKLKKLNYPAYSIKAVVPDKGTWYRVRVGTFNNMAKAKQTLEKLKKNKTNGFLISN